MLSKKEMDQALNEVLAEDPRFKEIKKVLEELKKQYPPSIKKKH